MVNLDSTLQERNGITLKEAEVYRTPKHVLEDCGVFGKLLAFFLPGSDLRGVFSFVFVASSTHKIFLSSSSLTLL